MRCEGSLEGDARRDLDTGPRQPIKLGRIVGEQHDPCVVEASQHAGGNAIIPLIILKAKHGVGVSRIQTAILKTVGAHFVRQADSPALLRKIQDDPAAEAFQVRKRKLKLVPEIPAWGAENASG